MKRSFKSLLLLGAVASGMILSSCKKNDNGVSPETQDQNIVVSVDLGGNGLRAAMTEAQEKVTDGAAATVKNIDVYLVTGNGLIKKAKRFASGDPEYAYLTKTEKIAAGKTEVGYKFVDVDAAVTEAAVVVNPQGTLGAVDSNINAIAAFTVKATVGDAVYADKKTLETVGAEPYGSTQADGAIKNGDVVKIAEFTLNGDMNRFQVTPKFSKIVFKSGKKDEYEAILKKHYDASTESTEEAKIKDAKAKTKAEIGEYNNGTPTGTWKDYFEVVELKATGAFMNRFNYEFNPFTGVASKMLEAQTYADGRYNTTDGTWVPNVDKTTATQDASEFASYYKADGYSLREKVLAFNFYVDGIKKYNSENVKENDCPKIHFYIKDAEEGFQYVNVAGYKDDTKTIEVGTNAGNQLINLNLKDMNGGDGIIVTSDDPNVEGDGTEDISKTNFNAIIRVTVKPWVAINVKPIVEK